MNPDVAITVLSVVNHCLDPLYAQSSITLAPLTGEMDVSVEPAGPTAIVVIFSHATGKNNKQHVTISSLL